MMAKQSRSRSQQEIYVGILFRCSPQAFPDKDDASNYFLYSASNTSPILHLSCYFPRPLHLSPSHSSPSTVPFCSSFKDMDFSGSSSAANGLNFSAEDLKHLTPSDQREIQTILENETQKAQVQSCMFRPSTLHNFPCSDEHRLHTRE